MSGDSPKRKKLAVVPHDDGTISIAVALHRYRFTRSRKDLKWSLALLDEKLDFLYEPVPGVKFQPRLVLRIEGRVPKNKREKAWELLDLHRIRSSKRKVLEG
jgi:hypothetical protein